MVSLRAHRKGAPVSADTGPENIVTVPAQGLSGGITSDLLRRSVHESDFPLAVRGKNPVGNAAQNGIEKLTFFSFFHH
jgi:hypothetical protein